MDIIRKLILLMTVILIALRCFFPPKYYQATQGRRVPLSPRYAGDFYPTVDTGKTAFECVGIALIGGVLFYILRGKKQGKD